MVIQFIGDGKPSYLRLLFKREGNSGDDPYPLLQYKRGRTDDAPCDKLKAVHVTTSEPDSPSLSKESGSMSYVSMLLNPLSHYGNVAIDDSYFTENDCSYSTGKMGPKVRFSKRVNDNINLE